MTRRRSTNAGEIQKRHTPVEAVLPVPSVNEKRAEIGTQFEEKLQFVLEQATAFVLPSPMPEIEYDAVDIIEFLKKAESIIGDDSPILFKDNPWMNKPKVVNYDGLQVIAPEECVGVDIQTALQSVLRKYENSDLPEFEVLIYYLLNKEKAKEVFSTDDPRGWIVLPGFYVRLRGQWFCFAARFDAREDRLKLVTLNFIGSWSRSMKYAIVPSRP